MTGHVAPLLISLAVGYGVLVLARREAKPLNRIGKVVGWLILVVSFVGLLCIAAAGICRRCHVKKAGGPMACPVGVMKGACVMPPFATSDEAAEAPKAPGRKT